METPEEFLIKYGICSDTTIGTEGDIPLTQLLEEYANQALRIHDVVKLSEQLKCPNCELEYYKEEIDMFRGLCESCRDRAF